jgi:hypothetical protein
MWELIVSFIKTQEKLISNKNNCSQIYFFCFEAINLALILIKFNVYFGKPKNFYLKCIIHVPPEISAILTKLKV